MKITIRTTPEIVIDVDSIPEEKKVEQTIVIPEMKSFPAVKPEPKAKTEKRGKGVRHCKKCGEAGHRSDHCPNGKPKKRREPKRRYKKLKAGGMEFRTSLSGTRYTLAEG